MKIIHFIVVLSCLLFFSCISYKSEIRAISNFQNSRDALSLSRFADHPSDDIQIHFARACASMQDFTLLEHLSKLIKCVNETLRAEAAFSIGQIQSTKSADILLDAYNNEKSKMVIQEILIGIGKTGSQEHFKVINSKIGEKIHKNYELMLMQFDNHGVDVSAGFPLLKRIMSNKNNDIRRSAWYALSRLQTTDISEFESVFLENIREENNQVQEYMIVCSQKFKSSAVKEKLFDFLTEPNWRIAVNALQSISKLGLSKITEYQMHAIFYAMHSQKEHIAMAALRTVTENAGKIDDYFLQEALEKVNDLLFDDYRPSTTRVRGEAYVTLCALNPKLNIKFIKEDWFNSNEFFRYQMLDGIKLLEDKANLLMIIDQMGFADIAGTKACELFVENWKKKLSNEKLSNEKYNNRIALYEPLYRMLLTGDLTKSVIAADALGDSLIMDLTRIDGLFGALLMLGKDSNVKAEVIVAILETIGQYKNSNSIPYVLPLSDHKNYRIAKAARTAYKKSGGKPKQFKPLNKQKLKAINWSVLEKFGTNPIIEIETQKGTISLQLDRITAPSTVANFIELIENGFYNGLFFHRVVSNFVIQSGDPHGDGWGGSDDEIASEFSRKPFLRGSIGMANSGKDTETSQFFICHSDQRHLDGNYTVFGSVITGMGIVDKIQIGDKILTIKVRGN